MVLPKLSQEQEKAFVVIAQKQLHKGSLFSAAHRGNSLIALDEQFGLKLTKINDNFINIDLVRYGMNAKSYTNIQFAPKKKTIKKQPVKKISKLKFKKEDGEILL